MAKAPISPRHYHSTFDLTVPVPPPQAAPVPDSKPTQERPPRTVTIPVRTRGPNRKQQSVASPIEAAPLPVSETYRDPDDRLTGLQKEMLRALDEKSNLIGADILSEARNVVRRNLTRVNITPTGDEEKIFHEIGIPGF